MSSTNVQVLVRCRPPLEHESDSPCNLIQCEDNTIRVQYASATDKVFSFDKVLDGYAGQEDVFEYTSPLVDHALDGLHATIFAYGQTGAGKTFTMEGFDYFGGNVENSAKLRPNLDTAKHKHGIIPRAVEALYDRAHQRMNKSSSVKYNIKCSYYQIYNEKVFDLLNSPWQTGNRTQREKVDPNRGLRIRWSKNNTFYVENLFIYECDTAAQVRELFSAGVKNKAMGSHHMNLQSSRSHSVFTLYIESYDTGNPECIIRSELTLVDLAGSEKLTLMSKNPSQKLLQESIEINASLLALGKVISALGSGSKNQHIPYRDAKLTKLLKHSLGGNSLTLMVACINPCDAYLEETVSTLFYSGRARNIRNDPRINEDSKTALIRSLRAEIISLKTELSHYRKLASGIEQNGQGQSVSPVGFENRPHTADPSMLSGGQKESVDYLGEKLVDSVKMLKDIIVVNGQLREAFDELTRRETEAETSVGQLNEENVQLRERIELLESIVMQEDNEKTDVRRSSNNSSSVKHADEPHGSRGNQTTSQPVPVHNNGNSHQQQTDAPYRRGLSGRKALEKYRTKYKQYKVPSYDDYYSIAATRRRSESRNPKTNIRRSSSGTAPNVRQPKQNVNPQQRAFEGIKLKHHVQQPLFTRRQDVPTAGMGLQSAAAIALEYSQAQQLPRAAYLSGNGNGQQGGLSQSVSSPMMLSSIHNSGDSDLDARRRSRQQRAAQLEAQHRQLQQRHAGNSYPPPSFTPQVPSRLPDPSPTYGHEGYLTSEEASNIFTADQIAKLNRRKQQERISRGY